MLDKRMQMMLEVANTLTGDDLDTLRGLTPANAVCVADPADELSAPQIGSTSVEPWDGREAVVDNDVRPSGPAGIQEAGRPTPTSGLAASRGEYERTRTRASKVSTTCLGREREKHDWWPVGTQLIGHMGSQLFTATVVENAQVKSGRSIMIMSGPAMGKLCVTPTRAAIEATEDYRQAHNLGRGGGVTNGWEFWSPAS